MIITNLDMKVAQEKFAEICSRYTDTPEWVAERALAAKVIGACGTAQIKQTAAPEGYEVVAVNVKTGAVQFSCPGGEMAWLWVAENGSTGISMVGNTPIGTEHPLWAASWA